MQMINIYEAKTKLSQLIARVNAGEEIIISKAGKPMAKLIPIVSKKKIRRGGQLKGKIWMSPDFDRFIPEEFLPYL